MRKTEAPALLNRLIAELTDEVNGIRGRSSLVVAAFAGSAPEGASATPAADVPSAKPAVRIRVPAKLAHRPPPLHEANVHSAPADIVDPAAQQVLSELNAYHLWLAAGAISAASRHFRTLFVVLGYLDPELWPCSAFGDIRMPEVMAKPLPWFEERAALLVDARGIGGVADAMSAALPSLMCGEKVVRPGVWLRGAELARRLIQERGGSVPEANGGAWFPDADAAAMEAARVLGFVSWMKAGGGNSTLWVVDPSPGTRQGLTSRFDSLLASAQECCAAANAVAMAHFGCGQQQHAASQPGSPEQAAHAAPVKKQESAMRQEQVRAPDPNFVPIKLREPTGARLRPVKVVHR